MPAISMFQGIVIYMHWDDHNPPHFHASFQNHRAVFDFDGNLIKGEFPLKKRHLVTAWAILHGDELWGNWELAQNDGELYRIDPLR